MSTPEVRAISNFSASSISAFGGGRSRAWTPPVTNNGIRSCLLGSVRVSASILELSGESVGEILVQGRGWAAASDAAGAL